KSAIVGVHDGMLSLLVRFEKNRNVRYELWTARLYRSSGGLPSESPGRVSRALHKLESKAASLDKYKRLNHHSEDCVETTDILFAKEIEGDEQKAEAALVPEPLLMSFEEAEVQRSALSREERNRYA
ncbi:hypothetical protein PFISCL1PPCAC_11705, partial [Pristionchus fissidentatus]